MKYFFKIIVSAQIVILPGIACMAQFTHQDTLRGSVGPGRNWWDVKHYSITVTPDYAKKTIKGQNTIQFEWIKSPSPGNFMQIDLQRPLVIDSVVYQKQRLKYEIDGNAWMVQMPEKNHPKTDEIAIYYHGAPHEAVYPPWMGGWIWGKDEKGRPWMTVACQGLGASVWYPCKDHQADEPDNGALLSIRVDPKLTAVGNGKLKNKLKRADGTVEWQWEVVNPINNYNIVPYIGYYTHFENKYEGEKGNLDCSFWVMDYNLAKAKLQFGANVRPMLKCFEEWMGPYPFYEDGYKLVESSHLGMEHQSAIAYGNKYLNGYLGQDRSNTGIGEKWDYIIIHESGHEWFGNNITTKDLADMWVQEGFTTYSETLFTECEYGKKAANDYIRGLRSHIKNDKPIIGNYGVNEEGSSDMYDKGANMLHTIRQVINDDALFKSILRGMGKDFYHHTVTSAEIETYMSQKSGKDLSKIFDQYLRTNKIPVLLYKPGNGELSYRWNNCIAGFNMPVKVMVDRKTDKWEWVTPTEDWQTFRFSGYDGATFQPDNSFYITTTKTQ